MIHIASYCDSDCTHLIMFCIYIKFILILIYMILLYFPSPILRLRLKLLSMKLPCFLYSYQNGQKREVQIVPSGGRLHRRPPLHCSDSLAAITDTVDRPWHGRRLMLIVDWRGVYGANRQTDIQSRPVLFFSTPGNRLHSNQEAKLVFVFS